jgi:hypothetical protein
MYYRLDDLEALSSELGFRARRVDADQLDVVIEGGYVLTFANMRGEEDSYVGFDGTPWHSHGSVEFMTSKSTSVTYDELELLIAIGSGDLVIVTEYAGDAIRDRQLAHKDEPLDISYMHAGDELRVVRVLGLGDGTPDA